MMKWKSLAVLGLVFGMSGMTWGLAQQRQNSRFFELRVYTAAPDRMDKLVARFRNHTTRLFEKHGMTNVGYWTAVSGDNAERTLVYIMAYPSREARKRPGRRSRPIPNGSRSRPKARQTESDSPKRSNRATWSRLIFRQFNSGVAKRQCAFRYVVVAASSPRRCRESSSSPLAQSHGSDGRRIDTCASLH